MTQFRMRNFQAIPPVIKNLIILNALSWLAELTFGDRFVSALSLHYYKSPDFGIWQLFTYMFLHDPGSIFHILFNMFALWMFGSVLENFWGSKRFLLFYLVCGVGAGIIQGISSAVEMNILVNHLNNGGLTIDQYREQGSLIFNGIALGASGAIMGVFAAFAYLFPNTTLFIIPIPFPIKAKYVIGGLILIDLFGGIYPQYGGGVAHFAHLGGVLIGFLLVISMNRLNRNNFY